MRFVLRLFFNVAIILLSISVIRVLLGSAPLSISYLLELLSRVDVDFSFTVGQIAKIANSFSTQPDAAWYEVIVSWLQGIYDAITLPIKLVQDLFSFILSVCLFITRLLGFDIFGI